MIIFPNGDFAVRQNGAPRSGDHVSSLHLVNLNSLASTNTPKVAHARMMLAHRCWGFRTQVLPRDFVTTQCKSNISRNPCRVQAFTIAHKVIGLLLYIHSCLHLRLSLPELLQQFCYELELSEYSLPGAS